MSGRMSVSWAAYQKNICNGFSFLQQRGEFVDMTLAADGHHVQVHKMVLCLVSPYIKELVAATQCAHPVIFLNNVSSATLEHILEYAYTGEAIVPTDKIKEFLQACKSLQIKGLENTSTVNLHRESEQSMSQGMSTTEPIEDIEEDVVDTSFDDGDNDYNDPFVDKNDQEMEITDDKNTTSTTDTPNTKTAKNPQLMTSEFTTALCKSSSSPSKTSQVQYTISNHGHLQIILNRYLYCFNYKRVKTDEMVWRCLANRKKCPATVVTKNGKVIERSKAHNHAFEDKTILKRLQQGLVYSELSDAQNVLEADKKIKVTDTTNNYVIVEKNLDDDDK